MSLSPVLPGPVNLHRAFSLESREFPDGTKYRVLCTCGFGRKSMWLPDAGMAQGAHDAHALWHRRAK